MIAKHRWVSVFLALLITSLACTRSTTPSQPQSTSGLSTEQQAQLLARQIDLCREAEGTPSAYCASILPTATSTSALTLALINTPNPTRTPTLTATPLTLVFGDISLPYNQEVAQRVVYEKNLLQECLLDPDPDPVNREFCPGEPLVQRVIIREAALWCADGAKIAEPTGFELGHWLDLDKEDPDDVDLAGYYEELLDRRGFSITDVLLNGPAYARPERVVTEFQEAKLHQRLLELCPRDTRASVPVKPALASVGSLAFQFDVMSVVQACFAALPEWLKELTGVSLLRQGGYLCYSDADCSLKGYCKIDPLPYNNECRCNSGWDGNGISCGRCVFTGGGNNGPYEIWDLNGSWEETKWECPTSNPVPPTQVSTQVPTQVPTSPPSQPPPGDGGSGGDDDQPRGTTTTTTLLLCKDGQTGNCILTRMQHALNIDERLLGNNHPTPTATATP